MNARDYFSRIAVLCLLALPVATSAFAQGKSYPEKAVMIISDAGAGSSPDVAMRIVADGLSKMWGQQAVVGNHPGANGSIAARAASQAVPGGHAVPAPGGSSVGALPTGAPTPAAKLPPLFLRLADIARPPATTFVV